MSVPELNVIRLPERFVSDDTRVIARFFDPGGDARTHAIVDRVMTLSDCQVSAALTRTLQRYNRRHRDIGDVLLEHYGRLAREHRLPAGIDKARQLLIGAYFTMEYSVESAALFNPSIVPAPNQDDLPPGALRIILSLRATGEGHVSSIVFRTGMIMADGTLAFDPPSPYMHRVKPVPNQMLRTGFSFCDRLKVFNMDTASRSNFLPLRLQLHYQKRLLYFILLC